MEPVDWTCPFCNRDTTITAYDVVSNGFAFRLKNVQGNRHFSSLVIVCPNPKCKRFTFSVSMSELQVHGTLTSAGRTLQTWNLIPPSLAKVFPDYVPQPIRDDYLEACNIRELSPKASATLSRRCLQGMIRDFWEIRKGRLIDEIEGLKDKVDLKTWEAIDAVRGIGNIGAHMEKDINLILDVDPEEAQKLIQLIELLIKDWYITRREREERLATILEVKAAKEAIRAGQTNGSNENPNLKGGR